MSSFEKVLNARSSSRLMGKYYIDNIFDGFMELHGDRRYADDGAIIGGVAWLGKIPVTVIAMERGTTLEERMKRNFGCPSPEGYRKALRLMKQAEKFHRPIICFIGSPGAYCGISAEERGQGEAIAENLMEMFSIKVPIISIVTGEGGSGGALALSVADRLIMLEDAVYSVISPEGCASILWKDSTRAADAAEVLKLTAEDLYEFGIIDQVVTERGRTSEQIAAELQAILTHEIKSLMRYSPAGLMASRYAKFRAIGTPETEEESV